MKAPQYFIDTFKDNHRGQPQNKYYMISGRGSGCLHVWDRQTGDVLRDDKGNAICMKIEYEAIQAAWKHFISQPEVRGLMEELISEKLSHMKSIVDWLDQSKDKDVEYPQWINELIELKNKSNG